MINSLKPVNLKSILLKYTYHWPLFILGIFIFISLALIYLKIAKPTYEIRATILVKDAKKTTEEKSALQELDQSESAKIAENEVEVISSRKIVSEVVKQLKLWVNYSTKDGLIETNLYKESPVYFSLKNEESDFNHSIIKVLLQKDGFLIIDDKTKKRFFYAQEVKSDFGNWKLEPTIFLNRYLNKEVIISINPIALASENYQNALQVSLLNKLAPTISLSINDKITLRGKEFLDTLISNYVRASTSEKSENSTTSISFIDKKIDSLRLELNGVEGAVQDFKSGNGLTDIDSESKSYLENIRLNENKLNDINVQIDIIQGIENYINTSRNSNNVPSTIGISDVNLANLIDRLSQLQVQKAKLLATTPESNYIFEPINNQINTTKTAIFNNVRTIKSSLITAKRQLETFNSKVQSSIRRIPGQERQSASLSRQQKAKEDLYNYLLQKRAELSLSYTATLSDARIVDDAYVKGKIWPQSSPVMAISGLLGLLLPFMVIYVRNNLKDKILTKSDIEEAVKVPILGELPQEYLGKVSLIDHSIKNALSEHFRAIRTKLYYLDKNIEKGRVILITSSVSGEGKSFVSSNLSTSLAFMGRKTILLELDLRKPKLSQNFNLKSQNFGLTDYLKDNVEINEIVQNSNFSENLDIITAGHAVNNPAELLTGSKLNLLINNLKEQYDDIILDSPPLHLVTDAMLISRLANITLYVVRQNVTNKAELDFISEIHQQNELPNLSIVFNGIAEGKFGYGNHYSNTYYTDQSSVSVKKFLRKFLSRF